MDINVFNKNGLFCIMDKEYHKVFTNLTKEETETILKQFYDTKLEDVKLCIVENGIEKAVESNNLVCCHSTDAIEFLPTIDEIKDAITQPIVNQRYIYNEEDGLWEDTKLKTKMEQNYMTKLINVYQSKLDKLIRFDKGVILVEDGSVDVDRLEDDGFYVIVYRQGAKAPIFIGEENK